ncbi:MAG: VOC family protein [Candidatus Thiodiazotropha sp. (ex Ctena orbiculata)]|nr:VOC family protein [Candidatus Thiodiazotropha taylori]
MIAHAHLHVSSYEASRDFYIKVLATLGYVKKYEVGQAAGFFDGKNTDLWVLKEDVVPTHLAFEAETKEEVEAFYKTAIEAGAKDNGGPGYRQKYWAGYYAAFVLDPDGHNIEAAYWDYEKAGDKRPD